MTDLRPQDQARRIMALEAHIDEQERVNDRLRARLYEAERLIGTHIEPPPPPRLMKSKAVQSYLQRKHGIARSVRTVGAWMRAGYIYADQAHFGSYHLTTAADIDRAVEYGLIPPSRRRV